MKMIAYSRKIDQQYASEEKLYRNLQIFHPSKLHEEIQYLRQTCVASFARRRARTTFTRENCRQVCLILLGKLLETDLDPAVSILGIISVGNLNNQTGYDNNR